ncbi:MAG: PEP/pyruvate-binding domain-containing protein, partial [Pseudomonadales bacterium]
MTEYILWFDQLSLRDVGAVGGKNASLGEMIRHLSQAGVNVPGGFATTTTAYRAFLDENRLADPINRKLETLDVDDVDALAAAGLAIRNWILNAKLPDALVQEISRAYAKLVMDSGQQDTISFAV